MHVVGTWFADQQQSHHTATKLLFFSPFFFLDLSSHRQTGSKQAQVTFFITFSFGDKQVVVMLNLGGHASGPCICDAKPA